MKDGRQAEKRGGAVDRLLAVARRISRIATWLGGALILAAAVLVAVDVLMRKLFVVTLGGADELAGYALAIGSALALAFALLERAHIRIDTLYLVLPARIAAVLDITGLVAFTTFMTLLTHRAAAVLEQSIQAGSTSMSRLGTPLAWPQTLWVAGLGLFLMVAALLIVRAVMAFITGDVDAVRRLAGPRTLDEELDAGRRAIRLERVEEELGG
jgi:TRAP-type mannitol/chloroaromatic compound transport system permease small subunit